MRVLLTAGILLPACVLAQFDLFFPPGVTLHGGHHVPVLPPAVPAANNLPVAQGAARGPIPAPDTPRPNAGLLKEVYAWRQMDFEYPSEASRGAALASGDFDPTGTLPLGDTRDGPAVAAVPAAAGAAWWRGLLFIFSINVMLLYLLLIAAFVVVTYLLVYIILHFILFVFHSTGR